jgi:hypothetical protein
VEKVAGTENTAHQAVEKVAGTENTERTRMSKKPHSGRLGCGFFFKRVEKVAGTENTLHPLELVLLEHGVEGLVGEDEVVQHGDAKELACALEAFGDIAVVIARGKVAAGVVVGDYDGGGPLTQGVGEDLRPTVVDDTIRLFHGRGGRGVA